MEVYQFCEETTLVKGAVNRQLVTFIRLEMHLSRPTGTRVLQAGQIAGGLSAPLRCHRQGLTKGGVTDCSGELMEQAPG